LATDYDEVPTLVERIIGADLVLVGRVGRLVDVRPDKTEGQRRVVGIFELEVEKVLKGDEPTGRVLLRLLGEGQDERAAWIVSVEEGKRMLFLLASDVGPELPERLFAPVFASGFEIEDDARIRIPPTAVDDLTREVARFDGSHVPLNGLQRLVEVVRRQHDERKREVEQFLPREATKRPYPEVGEVPPDVNEVAPQRLDLLTPEAQPVEIGKAPEAIEK